MSVDSETGSKLDSRMNPPHANPPVPMMVQPPVLLDGTSGQPPQGDLNATPLVPTAPIIGNPAAMNMNSAAEDAKPPTVCYNQRPAIEGIFNFAIKTHKSYYDQDCKHYYENYNVDLEC